MGRLILILLVAGLLAYAVISVMSLFKPQPTRAPHHKGDGMPDSIKTVAYVVLILLMFGITTGLVGGL